VDDAEEFSATLAALRGIGTKAADEAAVLQVLQKSPSGSKRALLRAKEPFERVPLTAQERCSPASSASAKEPSYRKMSPTNCTKSPNDD
jgi:hypothetical protein